MKKVAFVCLHGSAKSLIAAEYFNGLAHARKLPLRATTSGPEPDVEVPGNVIEGLRRHGIEVGRYRPTLMAPAMAGAGSRRASRKSGGTNARR